VCVVDVFNGGRTTEDVLIDEIFGVGTFADERFDVLLFQKSIIC